MAKTTKRNTLICRLILDAGKTQTEMAEAFGLTRERIRQIYAEHKPQSAPSYAQIRSEKAKKRKEIHDSEIAFVCKFCGKAVTRGERLTNRSVFCNDQCHKKWMGSRRDLSTTLTCYGCGKRYHPFINWRCPSMIAAMPRGRHFHSHKCYMKHRGKGLHS